VDSSSPPFLARLLFLIQPFFFVPLPSRQHGSRLCSAYLLESWRICFLGEISPRLVRPFSSQASRCVHLVKHCTIRRLTCSTTGFPFLELTARVPSLQVPFLFLFRRKIASLFRTLPRLLHATAFSSHLSPKEVEVGDSSPFSI